MSKTADAALCCVCGGSFTSERMWIEGRAYHQRCALMSYPPHTQADYQALSEQVTRLRSELDQARGMVEGAQNCISVWRAAAKRHAAAAEQSDLDAQEYTLHDEADSVYRCCVDELTAALASTERQP